MATDNLEKNSMNNDRNDIDSSLFINEINSINDNHLKKLINIWNNMKHKPKCIIFDLDYTLWPFILDSNVLPPFKRDSKTNLILDYNKKNIHLYSDVYDIITQLKKLNICLAIASRSTMQNQAIQLLEMFKILHFFDSIQIYSGTKLKHVKNIQQELNKKAGVLTNFDQMMFFDDNRSNLECVGKLGVKGHQVKRHYGLNFQELFEAITKYKEIK
jgi:magnesium-dependent phosphatase 1